MSSSLLSRFLPTSASEQTAKLCSGRPLSCVHSVRVWERRFRRGHEEEDQLVLPGDLLGDLQRGKGLAGAAGHDELATVGVLESEADFGLGADLMRAELLFGLERRGLAGLVFGPIDLRVLQVVEVDLVDRRLLIRSAASAFSLQSFVVVTMRRWAKHFLPEAVKKLSMSAFMTRWSLA
jgi:hypothetical protein